MKAFKTMCFVAAAAMLTLFTGCFNISGGNTGNMNETVEKNGIGKREITLTITNYDDLLEEATYTGSRAADVTAARTITAASFAPAALTYYITGHSSNGEDLIVTKVNPYSWEGNKGKVSLAVDAFTWDLQLYACDSTDEPSITSKTESVSADITAVKDKAVLAGKTSIDMYYTTDAYFALSPNGLDKQRSVNLTLKLGADWENKKVPNGYKMTAGIYDMETGEIIMTSKTSPSQSTLMEVPTRDSDAISDTNGFAYTANTTTGDSAITVSTGTYNFMVTFVNEVTNRTYVWSDVIIIIPGKDCVADVTIPNVIGKLPTAPANFSAGYITGSEDGVVTDRYKVVFHWEDKSNNESYFEIQMVDVEALREDLTTKDSDAAPKTKWAVKYETPADDTTRVKFSTWTKTTDVNWDDIDDYFNNEPGKGSHQYVYPEFVDRWGADFYATEEHCDGSLLANSETATMYLPLGTSYIARIRAVNDAGYSAPVTVDLTDANKPAGSTSYTGGTNAYGKKEYGTLYNAAATDPDRKWTTDDTAGKGVARTNVATTISRYRVRYNLQGGTYDPDGKGTVAPVTGSIVEYYCQDANDGNYILYPSATRKDTTEPYMQCGTSFFSYWAMGLETISNDTVYPYKDGSMNTAGTSPATDDDKEVASNEPRLYKFSGNLELYALYGAARVDVLYADKYPIKPEWVSYGYSASKGTAPTTFTVLAAETAAKTIEIVKKTSDTSNVVMGWKVSVPSDNKYNFETVSVKLYKGNVIYYEETLKAASLLSDATPPVAQDGVNLFDDMPLKRLPNGTYQLLIYATYGGGDQNGIIVTLPLSLSVVDEASS